MKTFTIADIRSWGPCYDPCRHLPENWTGTALDMLQHPTIPDKDKVWLVIRYDVMSPYDIRRFAIDCARRAQTYPKNYTPDPRTLRAIEVAEAFNEGRASAEELAVVRREAYAAYAAYGANGAADADAAATAAYDAAAYAAAYAAAAAAAAATDAAYAARQSERTAQVAYLIAVAKENLSRETEK